MSLTSRLLQPAKFHGFVFDGAYILSTLLIPLGVLEVDAMPSDRRIAILLGVAVIGQIAGASIKHQFLQPRLATRGDDERLMPDGFMGIVLFFHFLLFAISILLALMLGGIYLADEATSFWRGDVWVAFSLVLGLATTAIVAAAGTGSEAATAPEAPGWLEFVGDAFLLLSVWILTWLYWNMLIVAEVEGGVGAGFSGRGIVLLCTTTILFVVFYLPGRYLYLVEDYRSGLTWLQVALAIIPVYWAIVVG